MPEAVFTLREQVDFTSPSSATDPLACALAIRACISGFETGSSRKSGRPLSGREPQPLREAFVLSLSCEPRVMLGRLVETI